MGNSEEKNQGKGFAGLKGLSSGQSPPAVGTAQAQEAPVTELPEAWQNQQEVDAKKPLQPQSKTIAPKWRGWVVALGLIGAIVGFLIIASGGFGNTSSYSPSSSSNRPESAYTPPSGAYTQNQSASVGSFQLGNAVGPDNRVTTLMSSFSPRDVIHASVQTDGAGATLNMKWTYQDGQTVDTQDKVVAAGPQITDFSISKPDGWPAGEYHALLSINGGLIQNISFTVQSAPIEAPVIEKPPVGIGLVLNDAQIRYCVYGGHRIAGARKAVNNYSQASVYLFNELVDDYNRRCGDYRYRQGALAPIESEAAHIRDQLEQEGQTLMTGSSGAAANASGEDGGAAYAAQVAADAAAEAADAAATSTDAVVASKLLRDGHFPSQNVSGEITDDSVYQASFDCARAKSIPEYLICHDSELADDDRELYLIYQRAKSAVADRDALTERARKQWNYREENCRDKPCLLAWFEYQKDVMRKIAQTGDVNAR